jgi:hypothetical protein
LGVKGKEGARRLLHKRDKEWIPFALNEGTFMRFAIEWTFFLEVSTQQKCERIVGQIAELIGCELSILNIERYWKDETTFKILARSSFSASTIPDGLYTTMCMLNHLARTWLITTPAEDDVARFSGTAQKGSTKTKGVHAIFFESISEAIAPIQIPDVVEPRSA